MSLVSAPNFEEVFGQMVAGTLPLAAGNPMGSVSLVVRDLLGTDAVHAVVAADAKTRRVHYFAVPSRVLHSTADLSLPLTAAIPSHPDHEGDGAYVLHSAPVSAVAILRNGELRLIVNEATLVEAFIAESGLPAYDVGTLETGWTLSSRRSEVQRVADRTSAIVARGAGGVAIVAAVAYVGLSAGGAWMGAGRDGPASPQQQESMMSEAISRVQLASPLAEQLGRLQGISAVVVRAGGWIDSYQWSKGVEHYRLVLPEWVTRDYLAALDPGVRADRNGDGTIEVIKGAPGKDGKPGAPAPAVGPLVEPSRGQPDPTVVPPAGEAGPGAARSRQAGS